MTRSQLIKNVMNFYWSLSTSQKVSFLTALHCDNKLHDAKNYTDQEYAISNMSVKQIESNFNFARWNVGE